MKTLGIVQAFLVLVAFGLAIGALMGVAAAWVLSYFGVIVPWYVCWVGIIILGSIFKGVTVSK